ncbi:MAG: hypothetical protein CMC08_09340 [Flavobacteriaceae bacterium]|nr:hypothetical protein [Flavobacteriaceae bacterium]
MAKLGIVITDGVGFRNFVLSDFLREAQHQWEEVVILSFLPHSIYKKHIHCRVIELPVLQESFVTWFFRKAKELAHLQLHKRGNFGITDNLLTNSSTSRSPRGRATRLLLKWTAHFHSEAWIARYTKQQQRQFRNKAVTRSYTDLLQAENFDLLFFTHQRPPYLAPLAYVAQRLSIPMASFIFSWDNLASKGRMAADFDYYLVWSELMKSELLQFYSRVRPENIEVVGTPQFEPYILTRYHTTKAEFHSRFGLEQSKKTICFSCGDISTSKNDERYIRILAEAIRADQIPNAQLLVRTSPAEDPVRFRELANTYTFIIWNYPDWNLSREGHPEPWSQRVPTEGDVRDLRALLQHCDLNINMLSTMSLDFMQFNKPVINPVFGNPENGLYNDQRFLKYAHIEHLVESGATKIVKNETELLEAVGYYLENPEADSENRSALTALEVGCPLEGTGKRMASTLKKWI